MPQCGGMLAAATLSVERSVGRNAWCVGLVGLVVSFSVIVYVSGFVAREISPGLKDLFHIKFVRYIIHQTLPQNGVRGYLFAELFDKVRIATSIGELASKLDVVTKRNFCGRDHPIRGAPHCGTWPSSSR